jgi:hypothetical protein
MGHALQLYFRNGMSELAGIGRCWGLDKKKPQRSFGAWGWYAVFARRGVRLGYGRAKEVRIRARSSAVPFPRSFVRSARRYGATTLTADGLVAVAPDGRGIIGCAAGGMAEADALIRTSRFLPSGRNDKNLADKSVRPTRTVNSHFGNPSILLNFH